MKRTSPIDWFLIGAFLLLLFLPFADSAFHLDRVPPPDERRALAEFPVWTGASGLRSYAGKIEIYFNDHFGYRNSLVKWYHKRRRSIFGSDRSSASRVLAGKDGWYFYAPARMVESYRRTLPFGDEELELWRAALQRRHDWLAKQGIRYLLVIPPNKETVYPDYVPDWLKRVGRESRKDQLLRVLRERSSVEVLDLEEPLRRNRARERLYWKTDSHWNDAGAFVAYGELMDRLNRWFPEMTALPRSAFRESVGRHKADLPVLMGIDLPEEEGILFARIGGPLPVAASLPPLDGTETLEPSMPPVAMEVPGLKRRALILRDSYMTALYPFLAPHFGRTVSIYTAFMEGDLVLEEKPDVVIQQILERKLVELVPADLARRDQMPGVTN